MGKLPCDEMKNVLIPVGVMPFMVSTLMRAVSYEKMVFMWRSSCYTCVGYCRQFDFVLQNQV